MSVAPHSIIDIFSDDVLLDPYEAYKSLRQAGPVVYLPQYDIHVVSRYEITKALLGNWQDYTSRHGVSATHEQGGAFLLLSDPPEHDEMRSVISRPLRPGQLKNLEGEIENEAAAIAGDLMPGVPIEAVSAIARIIPVSIISRLVGLPEEGRARMLDWAFASFNTIGPDNDRRRESLPVAQEMGDYILSVSKDQLRPGSWARALFEAVEMGDLDQKYMPFLLMDYVAPSLDTTIAGITNALWCFATHPDQWRKLRSNPELMNSAINEVLRFQSPVLGFARVTTKDTRIGDIIVPSGSRVVALYASANRDERFWEKPDEFLIDRKPNNHLAFGFGIHSCMGMHLARLETRAILSAIISRFEHIKLLDQGRVLNNALRTFSRMDIEFS